MPNLRERLARKIQYEGICPMRIRAEESGLSSRTLLLSFLSPRLVLCFSLAEFVQLGFGYRKDLARKIFEVRERGAGRRFGGLHLFIVYALSAIPALFEQWLRQQECLRLMHCASFATHRRTEDL